MEPVTTAGAFATIVGLVCNFMSERRARSDDEYKAFMQWLSEKRHVEIVEAIHSNEPLAKSLESLLRENHDEVVSKLTDLDKSLMQLASRIEGVRNIAHAIAPNIELSEQAISILRQFNESGGSFFLEMKMAGGTYYDVRDGSGAIEIDEPRFVDDDLKQLCDLGLLIPELNSNGWWLYRITRASVSYVAQMQSQS